MNFYSYGYLTHNSSILNDVLIWVGIIIGLTILVFGIKYVRNRTNLKYRNVLITLLLFATLIICLEVGRIQNQQSTKDQIGQTAQIMRNVSHSKHVPLSKVYTSSTSLNNGMTIQAGRRYYQVNVNSANSTYHLSPTKPINRQNKYISKNRGINLNFSNGEYLNIALKLIIGFVMLVVQINLAGKGNLAPTNAIDQLQNYVLGGIVGGIIYNQAITVLQFIIVILIWSIIIFGSRILITQSDFFKELLNGSPKIVINHGRINVDTALRSGLSASDLVFKLRNAGVNDFQGVKRVVIEQNGQLSIEGYHDSSINYPIITDGSVDEDALKQIHKNRKWLLNLLKLKKQQIKSVYLGQIVDGQLVLTLYPQHEHKLLPFLPNHKINLKQFKAKFTHHFN